MRWPRRMLYWIGRVEQALAAAILIGIVLMILAQVALNAGLGNPIAWEQEAGAYALVWLTFLGASIALKQMRHVTIVSFVGFLPPAAQALIRILVYLAMLWVLYVLMRELLAVIAIESRAQTIALPIDLPRSLFFSIPLFGSCALMALTVTLFLIETVGALAAGRGAKPAPLMK